MILIKRKHYKQIFNFVFLIIMSKLLIMEVQAKVTAKNFDFSIDKIRPLFPGSTLKAAKENFPKFIELKNSGELKKINFKVNYTRYVFDVFVQVKGDKIVDFFARLPQYFLHDVFHAHLIEKLEKKQDQYLRENEQAIYVWKNVNGNIITYSGACTITCFPTFLSVTEIEFNKNKATKSLLKELLLTE